LVFHIKGRTQTEGVYGQSAEENMWIEKDKMVGVWRKLRNEELHNLYSPPIIIRAIDQEHEMGRTGSTYVVEKRSSGIQIGIGGIAIGKEIARKS
jgi:hypothetical protein